MRKIGGKKFNFMKSEKAIRKAIERYQELIKKVNKESEAGIISYEEYSKKTEIYYNKLAVLEWVLR